MDKTTFLTLLEQSRVIAAVKDESGLAAALKSDCRIVFLLFGDVMSIPATTKMIAESGRAAMVHVDLIDGLSARDVAVDYIAKNTAATGVISTKSALVRRADSLGLLAVQRFFLLDSMSLQNVYKQLPKDAACAVELLPGLMPKIISEVSRRSPLPVIAGGLISDEDDVAAALAAGACAVSSTNSNVWKTT